MKLSLVFIPCFSGAAWELREFPMLAGWPNLVPTLPAASRLEDYVEWVRTLTRALPDFVLIGDSFGAAVALAAASTPYLGRLRGLVASGGFAVNPLRQRALAWLVRSGPHPRGASYRYGVLPMHGRLLASPYDCEGDRPWRIQDSIRLFQRHTPASAYWARAHAAVTCDLRSQLPQIAVPTLLLTPEDDRLIAPAAIEPLLRIPHHWERCLPRTGHMFRFSHPTQYGEAIRQFLGEVLHDA